MVIRSFCVVIFALGLNQESFIDRYRISEHFKRYDVTKMFTQRLKSRLFHYPTAGFAVCRKFGYLKLAVGRLKVRSFVLQQNFFFLNHLISEMKTRLSFTLRLLNQNCSLIALII